MKTFAYTLVCLSCFALCGCRVGPDYERPVFFSNERVEKALELKPTNHSPTYQIDFNDPVLRSLIAKAQQNAPTIRLAMVRLRQTRLSTKIAQASLGPTLDITGLRQFEKQSRNMDALVNEDYYNLGFDASWEIDIWGGTRRRIEAAKANEAGAIESLKKTPLARTVMRRFNARIDPMSVKKKIS